MSHVIVIRLELRNYVVPDCNHVGEMSAGEPRDCIHVAKASALWSAQVSRAIVITHNHVTT